MKAQTQTQPVVTQEFVLNGLDQLSNRILDVIRVDPRGTIPVETLREIDREISGLWCAIKFGQPSEQVSQ